VSHYALAFRLSWSSIYGWRWRIASLARKMWKVENTI